MRRVVPLSILAVLFLLASCLLLAAPASAHCYEVLNRVTNSSNACISIPIKIYDEGTGALVYSGYSANNCDSLNSNFRIDLNNNCTEPRLQPGTLYVVQFHYSDATRSAYFERQQLLCGETSHDTYYDIAPSGITQTSGQCLEEFWGYPNATLPLSVSLTISNVNVIGDKTIYTLKATASNGTGSYSFSWSGATPQGTSTENPNYAVRTILRTTTVSVTVTSGGESVTKTKTLYSEWF